MIPIKVLLVIVMFCVSVFGYTGFNTAYLAGSVYSLHLRTSEYTLHTQRTEVDKVKPLHTFGVLFGKNFQLSLSYRIVTSGDISYGIVNMDTLWQQPLTNGMIEDLLVRHQYMLLSFQTGVARPFPVFKGALCLYLGAGGNFSYTVEQERLLRDQAVRISDPILEEHVRVSMNAKSKLSYEHKMGERLGISFGYSLKLWTPVAYKTHRDLFPLNPILYQERFITHSFEIVLLAIH